MGEHIESDEIRRFLNKSKLLYYAQCVRKLLGLHLA